MAEAVGNIEKVNKPGKKALHVALAVTTLAAGGTVVGYGIHRVVDPAFLDHLQGKLLSSDSSKKSDIFDSTATSGVIKPSMVEKIPQEEIDKLDPFAKISDRNTIQTLFPLDISVSKNPNSEIRYRKSLNISDTTPNSNELEAQGFRNMFRFDNVPPGTIIKAPVDGKLTVFTDSNNSPINDHDYSTGGIDFKLPDGRTFRLIISGATKNSRGDVFKSLTNAPSIGSNMSLNESKTLKNNAITVKRGDNILQVADKEIMMSFEVIGDFDYTKAYKGKLSDGTEVTYVPQNPTNLEFFASPNGQLTQK